MILFFGFVNLVEAQISPDSLFPLSATCRTAPSSVRTNTPVTWTVQATGGSGNYTYKWNGANMDQSTAPTVTVSYGSIGTKNATVTVTSGNETTEASCSVVVNNNLSNTNQNSGGGSSSEGTEFTAEAAADSDARKLSGELGATTEGDLTKMLEGLIGGVLECSIENILAQGLQGILGGLGDALFGGTELGSQLGEAGGVIDEALGAILQQPMVPTNPVPLVKPINNVAAKEVGVSVAGGLFQMPSLDAIAYCLANSVIQYTSEGTARWLNTGFEGNPAFIENYNRFFKDVKDIETERYLQELASSQSCGNVNANIASNLAKQQQRLTVSSQKCNPTFAQPNNIIKIQDRVNFLDPTNNPDLREIFAYAELRENQSNAQELAKIEAVDANQGFIPQKNEEGDEIIVPAPIYLADATQKLNVPTQRLSELDEIGEILQELFKAVVTMVPGGILRKVLEEI